MGHEPGPRNHLQSYVLLRYRTWPDRERAPSVPTLRYRSPTCSRPQAHPHCPHISPHWQHVPAPTRLAASLSQGQGSGCADAAA